jgi:autotransporter-associated beta strand protein
MKARHLAAASRLAAFTLTLTAPALRAAPLTWDTTADDGATVTAGSGNWNTTAGNLVWNDGTTPNVAWSQSGTTTPVNSATFAGTDGAEDEYVVTLGSQRATQSLTFNTSGYRITGSTIYLPQPTPTTTPTITVAANKTATINSTIANPSNVVMYTTVGAGGTLNLGGGYPGGSNYQPRWTGAGTINMTGGSFQSNTTILNVAQMNQTTGGTVSSTYQIWINNAANQDVSYTLSNGTLSSNASQNNRDTSLVLGHTSGNYTGKFTVTGGTVNIGTTASNYGYLAIVGKNANGNGLLDVRGGNLTVGTGQAANRLYFFKDGANAGKAAAMTQSAGTVTAQGIQFGTAAGAYDAAARATLQLTGGNLYVGAFGIARDAAAANLPVTIQLSGGTLGASAAWSSALDMKLGAATIQAADSGGTPRNITLSGMLSNDDAADGSLTKTGGGTLTLSGANSYTGATTITAGTLALGASNVLPDTTAVSIGAATLDAPNLVTDTAGTLDPTGAATINLGTGATLAFADSSAIDWTGGTLNLTGTFLPGVSLRFGTTNAGLTADQLLAITATGFADFRLTEDGFLTVADSIPPTLVSITDNKDGGPIAEFTTVTYTVTFSEPMKASTIDDADFANAGDAEYFIGAVQPVSSTVFTVQVTPTTPGTLQLQIPPTATITDAVGNPLDCDPALADDSTLTVNNASAPMLFASGIVADKDGALVAPNMVVTYTVTFGEDMDDTTVTAADFGNAGTATFTIGSITETAPGVFTVTVTPTSSGTLQLKINANAVLRAAASGNVMNTTSVIADDTTIPVRDYLFWDTVNNGTDIDAGSGDWNTTAENTVWNNLGTHEPWTQTSATVPLKDAVFAGADGTPDSYIVTLASQMSAKSLTIDSSGYAITGSVVALMPTATTNGAITLAAGKTATISSTLGYNHNRGAALTLGSGSTLNLGGGTQGTARPQWSFSGAGTLNLTGGHFQNTIGALNAASINLGAGATHTMTDATNVCTWIGNGAGQDVSYTVSGGTLNSLGFNDTQTGYALAVGTSTGSFTSSLVVKDGGTVNIGTTTNRCGQLNIGSHNGNANALVEVQGGTLTVGTGKAANKILLFAAGADPGKAAALTQSGGTVTTQGIQFGANTGGANIDGAGSNGSNPYDASASATLQLTGGQLFVGPLGINRGSAAAALPVSVRLAGGTLACSAADWASALDINLGTSGGGVTIQAADSLGAARNITLSGNLADDGAASGGFTKTGGGTLTLTGANTFSGNTTVNAGTLTLSNAPDPDNANPNNDAAAVTLATDATLNLTYTGTDKVDALFIGTTRQAAGVYGKAGSPAPVIGIPQITGDGTLTVATGPGEFSGWITGTFAGGATVPSGQQGPTDDPDHDGIPNLVEYAIAGQDPTVGNAAVGTFTANSLSFTKRADANGLTYAIVESTDLGLTDAWTEVTGGSYVNSPTSISYLLTPGSPVRNFIRLKITQTP